MDKNNCPNLALALLKIEADAIATANKDHSGETYLYQGDLNMSPQITEVLRAVHKDYMQHLDKGENKSE